jgi:hypothetical protein
MDLGEVNHEGKRKPYSLTDKGLNELDRIEAAQKMRESSIRYVDEIDSSSDLTFKLPSLRRSQSFLMHRSLLLRELPLPIPVKVAIYGSGSKAFNRLRLEIGNALRGYYKTSCVTCGKIVDATYIF